jgi:hypothetical protein
MTMHASNLAALAAIAAALPGCDGKPSPGSAVSAAMSAGAASTGTSALPEHIALVSAFESDLHTPFGNDWRPVNDQAGGGVSTAQAELVAGGANGTAHALRVHGKVTVGDYLFPMGGIGLPLGAVRDHMPSPVDIARYSGVEFWVKGDGKRYMLRVMDDDVKDFNFHHYPFTTTPDWQLVRLRFADLKQFDWGQRVAWTGRTVSAFLFTNYSPPGEDFGDFEFFLDEISFF